MHLTGNRGPAYTVGIFGTIFVSQCASAQSATIEVVHNSSNAFVAPGEQVTISLRILHSGFFMVGRWRGDVFPSPNLGTASGAIYGVPIASPGLSGATPGVVAGGGISNAQFQHSPPLFVTGPYQPWVAPDFEFLRYTWTAPTTPGPIDFDWTPHPDFPLVEGYQAGFSVALTPYPTTYLGTTLTVIPAPAAAPLLLAAALAPRRRR